MSRLGLGCTGSSLVAVQRFQDLAQYCLERVLMFPETRGVTRRTGLCVPRCRFQRIETLVWPDYRGLRTARPGHDGHQDPIANSLRHQIKSLAEALPQDTQQKESSEKGRIRDGAPHHGSSCVRVFWHQLGTRVEFSPFNTDPIHATAYTPRHSAAR